MRKGEVGGTEGRRQVKEGSERGGMEREEEGGRECEREE